MENTDSYGQYVPTFFFLFLVSYPILIFSITVQQDFPFYIRIPESLPPTIALEKGGRFRPKNSLCPTTNYNFSWYQVRVDCHGLHQGQEVRRSSQLHDRMFILGF